YHLPGVGALDVAQRTRAATQPTLTASSAVPGASRDNRRQPADLGPIGNRDRARKRAVDWPVLGDFSSPRMPILQASALPKTVAPSAVSPPGIVLMTECGTRPIAVQMIPCGQRQVYTFR